MRVSIHSSNPKNQVKAFLYEDSKATRAVAWTSGSRTSSSLLHPLKPQQKAYRFKLEYESLDEDDPCPTFDLRVSIKPMDEVVSENFRCYARIEPPTTVTVKGDDFSLDNEYSFSSNFIQKVNDGDGSDLEYDMVLEWPDADPAAEFYLDVETRSDFLTSQLTFTLLYEGHNRELKLLGRSQQVSAGPVGGQYVQRLKLLDQEGDIADDMNISGAVLRLRLPASALQLFETLKDRGHLANVKEICHNFELSIRAEKMNGENEAGEDPMGKTRLVRVRWDGERFDDGIFDPA